MINIEDDGLFEVFPAIKTISETFEYQNSMLNKIVLTGKINALEIAENLFNFTEQTAQTFTELQSEIVLNLLRENKNELFLKAKSKAKIAIDTLMRNIHLRKSDIETLANDFYLNEFIKGNISKQQIEERLNEFVNKYTIYNEIMIFDTNGNVKVNINKNNKVKKSKDDILYNIKDDIVIQFRSTDMFIREKTPLFYVKKLENAVLVIFLNFKEETKIIFENLITEQEIITIVDKHNNILVSSEKGIDRSFVKGVKNLDTFNISNNIFHVKEKSDFDEMEWYCVVSYKKRKDINIMAEFSQEEQNNHLAQINLNNEELKKLADDGYAILEDLSDVIINGELIAAKSKQYILIPILDNLREVSFRIVKLIELSITSLQKIINESISNDVSIMSKFIVDSLIRNLYERCNDIKWWAMFLEYNFDKDISSQLKYLNNMYPYYSDIFVYNDRNEIISISNTESLIGEKIQNNSTISNKDSNKCFVTNFVVTQLYNNQKTFVYLATIFKDGKAVGGVGAVFDANNQFKEIIDRVFLYKEANGLIVDKDKNILYSTNEEMNKILDSIEHIEDGIIKDIKLNNKQYKISISKSKGYREYKNDNIFSVVLMER